MILNALDSTLQIGLLYSIVAIAVAFSFRVIGFPDLTPDGSFTLGAATGAVLLLNGASTPVAMLGSVMIGATCGVVTALLHTRLGISKLLSGILVVLMLYSVSLRIMGTPNLALLTSRSFLSSLVQRTGTPVPILTTLTLCAIVVLCVCALMRTQIGLELRATGDSETALGLRGLNREPYYIVGLAIANAIAAWAGYIIAQYQGFADISMGTGIVITALAAVVIGETIVRPRRVSTLVLAPVLGMLLYQAMIAVALRLGLAPADLRISTAALALIFVGLDRLRTRRGIGRQIGNRSF